jgi:hypothetical protein
MGLKGYRLWVMGQLDSTCRAPPRCRGARAWRARGCGCGWGRGSGRGAAGRGEDCGNDDPFHRRRRRRRGEGCGYGCSYGCGSNYGCGCSYGCGHGPSPRARRGSPSGRGSRLCGGRRPCHRLGRPPATSSEMAISIASRAPAHRRRPFLYPPWHRHPWPCTRPSPRPGRPDGAPQRSDTS